MIIMFTNTHVLKKCQSYFNLSISFIFHENQTFLFLAFVVTKDNMFLTDNLAKLGLNDTISL